MVLKMCISDFHTYTCTSYLSDYHIHRQKKLDNNLSGFQIKLTEFADNIMKLEMIMKLVHLTNRSWLMPLQCAQAAINKAGSTKFPFCVQYQTLALGNKNDIELVNDQHLLRLQWQQEPEGQIPGSFFLHGICTKVFNLVIYFLYT